MVCVTPVAWCAVAKVLEKPAVSLFINTFWRQQVTRNDGNTSRNIFLSLVSSRSIAVAARLLEMRVQILVGTWISVFCECYVSYRYRSVRKADPSSTVVLPCVCVCMCVRHCVLSGAAVTYHEKVGVRIGQREGKKERKKERKKNSSKNEQSNRWNSCKRNNYL